MKRILILTVLLAFALNIKAETPATETTPYTRNGNEVLFKAATGDVKLEFCTPDMFRIRKSRNNSFEENENWMVVKYDWSPVNLTIEDKGQFYALTTDALRIKAFKSPFRLEVADKKGEILYTELPQPNFDADSVVNTCFMQPDEHFFGFGERMDFLDQRGKKVYLNVELGRGPKPAVGGKDILRANYCPVPFFMSNKGYGIFFHTGFPSRWDMGWSDNKAYSFKGLGGELDYYFIYGPGFYDMLDTYTDLTGKAPMIPRFALGLHLGTYSGGTWKNEQMTSDTYPVDLVRKMRRNKIPFDLLWLDSTWRFFNVEKYGNGGATFEWRETFKDPKGMFDSIYKMDVKMVGLHIRSIMDNGPELKLMDQAIQNNAVYPNAQSEGLVNFFDPKSVDWWWDNAMMRVASIGAKFVKTDVGGTMRLKPGIPEEKGKESARLHNIYPLAYAQAPYNKFQEYNNMRGFNHTREGYAGIQRYPFIWAGDWGTEWQWFEPVIRGGLNIGMSGVGYWSHCMGGFEQYSDYDTELYTRWVQFGMFSPIAILFGMDHPRYHEPWTYGEEAMANFIKYDSMRYTLLPYMYSNAYEMYRSGRPLMTPLLMDYPNDENTYNMTDQYMFGPGMMICPVTTKNALSRPVYFPGGEWFDYWTGERFNGRQYKSFLTPLDVLPIFIKAGAIIPMQPAMQFVDETPVNVVTLDVYPAGQSSYDMYEDDGVSLDYKSGKFALTNIVSDLGVNNWTLNIAKPAGNYKPAKHKYLVKSYLEKEPSTVIENSKSLAKLSSAEAVENGTGWYYDPDAKRLWIKTTADNEKDITLVAK